MNDRSVLNGIFWILRSLGAEVHGIMNADISRLGSVLPPHYYRAIFNSMVGRTGVQVRSRLFPAPIA